MTAAELQLMKRAAKTIDDIGCREHSHSRSCPARQAQFARCTCNLEDQEEELLAVLQDIQAKIKENE